MYPHWRSLLPDFSMTTKAGISIFSYGFYRGYKAEYAPPHDLIGHRLAAGFFNGIFYTFPPYGLFRLADIGNRAEIAYTGKSPKDYPAVYQELFGHGTNPRVF